MCDVIIIVYNNIDLHDINIRNKRKKNRDFYKKVLMKFTELIHIISETDAALKQRALLAINQSVTFRNWLTGFYIFEFEQNGEDKTVYGSNTLPKLAANLKQKGLKGFS